MANQKIFCAVPWHNTHLYWDGTYGVCCSEAKKAEGTKYNIQNTSLVKWYDSDTMQNFRNRILDDKPLPECSGCYIEESHGHESRRIKENFKVGIFTEQAFDKSFQQSPWKENFSSATDRLPIDWHIDFGNECNLACKMCYPRASSKIAFHYDKWQISYSKNPNWINDDTSWQQFLKNVKSVPRLHRIHVMGGEPFVNKKFFEFVQWLIDNKLTHISLSFVTNGTILNHSLLDNLCKFSKVDIEISVESLYDNNHYIRQGSNTEEVWKNIEYIHGLQNDSLSLVLRSVPQLLSVNNYHDYIWKAHELGLSIQSIPLREPDYLAILVLPYDLRQQFKTNYENVKNQILEKSPTTYKTLTVGRDTSRLSLQLVRECNSIIKFLDDPEPVNKEQLRAELIVWLNKWDRIYKLNATKIYPEYKEFFQKYGYEI
jgi:sulfatase maturation enzyme AslB (radical SAM superfamily)